MNFRNQKWQLSFTNMHLESLFKTFINNLKNKKQYLKYYLFNTKQEKKLTCFSKTHSKVEKQLRNVKCLIYKSWCLQRDLILLDSVERYEFSFYYMYEITIYQASILSRKLHNIRITFLKLYAFEEKKQLIYISLSFLQTIVFKVNMPIISNHIDLSCKLKNNDEVTFIFLS